MKRLTEEQLEFYKENGYIVLKNIIPEALVQRITEEYEKLFQRKKLEKVESAWVGSETTNKTDSTYTVKGVPNLQYHHAIFSELLFCPSLLDAMEDVMGTSDILLHHTKAHLKPPEKGAAYPMHQDYHYFPHMNHSPITVFLHLDPAGPENGGLFVYPGSHKLGPLEDVGSKEGNYHYVDQMKFPLENATPVISDRGDVVIFSYLLVHGSPANVSSEARRMLLVQAAGASDAPVGLQTRPPGHGWLLRGANVARDATIAKRFET